MPLLSSQLPAGTSVLCTANGRSPPVKVPFPSDGQFDTVFFFSDRELNPEPHTCQANAFPELYPALKP